MSLIEEVKEDLERRRRTRRQIELQWIVNMNFLAGNQYCKVAREITVEQERKNYAWESRQVFNHIAPIMETRLSKLARLSPSMAVRASGNDETDIETAKLSTKILAGVMGDLEFSAVIADCCRWSEICGTAFYKVIWDNERGKRTADDRDGSASSGDVNIVAVSPFEIYPENMSVESLSRQKSIIQAKALTVGEIYDLFGVKVSGRKINVHTLDRFSSGASGDESGMMEDAEIVIEKYELPSRERPEGRLLIVVGDTLVHDGELPYANGCDGARTYPFIRQISLSLPGCFYGMSMIERLIPVQRAYNAVKNRKYEYLARISMGILKVEDGSVDTEALMEDGLMPGSVLVYRQGANPPAVMENFTLPADFIREEDRLLGEFILISGVSELTRSSRMYSENISGTALQMLSEIEDTKLLVTIESLKRAVKEAAKQVLRLYRQFAETPRLVKISGERSGVEVVHFTKSSIAGDDVVFDTESDFTQSLFERRSTALELVKYGLIADENGKINNRMRGKVLEILGFGNWENSQDIAAANMTKAAYENVNPEKIRLLDIDDDDIHIAEHSKHVLSRETSGVDEKQLEELLAHIEEHRRKKLRMALGDVVNGVKNAGT